MLIRKLVSLLLIGTIGVLLGACSTNRTLNDFKNGKDRDTLEAPIVHDVYNYKGKPMLMCCLFLTLTVMLELANQTLMI